MDLAKTFFGFVAVFAVLLIATSCTSEVSTPIGEPNDYECVVDEDCLAGGCSGELCLPRDKVSDVYSICIYMEEYECLKLTKCKCINGKCEFEQNEAYLKCMEQYI